MFNLAVLVAAAGLLLACRDTEVSVPPLETALEAAFESADVQVVQEDTATVLDIHDPAHATLGPEALEVRLQRVVSVYRQHVTDTTGPGVLLVDLSWTWRSDLFSSRRSVRYRVIRDEGEWVITHAQPK